MYLNFTSIHLNNYLLKNLFTLGYLFEHQKKFQKFLLITKHFKFLLKRFWIINILEFPYYFLTIFKHLNFNLK